jgi:hypothetical protein
MTQYSFFENQLYYTNATFNIVNYLKDIGVFDDVIPIPNKR